MYLVFTMSPTITKSAPCVVVINTNNNNNKKEDPKAIKMSRDENNVSFRSLFIYDLQKLQQEWMWRWIIHKILILFDV